jgi:hypothetical protein
VRACRLNGARTTNAQPTTGSIRWQIGPPAFPARDCAFPVDKICALPAPPERPSLTLCRRAVPPPLNYLVHEAGDLRCLLSETLPLFTLERNYDPSPDDVG